MGKARQGLQEFLKLDSFHVFKNIYIDKQQVKTDNKHMKYNDLFKEMKEASNATKALEMSAYMKNLFTFLGVQTPIRKVICKKYFKNEDDYIDFDFIDKCYKNKYREFQYIAIDYLKSRQKYLNAEHIENLKEYAITKSWWDTVDSLDMIIGDIALRYEEVNKTLLEWSKNKNIWLRRIAIDHQLLRKDKTDKKLLEKIILNNLGSKEFFINKAIGWSLRDFSKTNPKWVKEFIKKNEKNMSPLSIKEASKYI